MAAPEGPAVVTMMADMTMVITMMMDTAMVITMMMVTLGVEKGHVTMAGAVFRGAAVKVATL